MKVTLTDISEVKKQLSVVIPAEEVARELDAAYFRIGQKANLKGFRPGKVPRPILEQNYRQDVESDAIRNLISKSYPEAVRETGVVPIASPEVTLTGFGPFQDLTYQALVELRPTLEAKGYSGLSLEQEKVSVSDNEVMGELKKMQERMAQLVPVAEKRRAKALDVVSMDYQGFLSGELVKDLSGKESIVELGKGYLFPELETGLLEMTPGEKKKLRVTYPKEWADKKLAGQAVDFEIDLKEIKEKKMPELNDDFAKDLGSFTTLEEVKDKVKTEIVRSKEQASKNKLRTLVIERLIKENVFQIPEAMIQSELEHMFHLLEENLKAQGISLEQAGIQKEDFFTKNRDESIFRVKGALIFDAIAQKENIQVSPQEVDQRIAEMARMAGQSEDAWKRYYQKNEMLAGIAGVILEEKTLDFVLSQSKIKVK